jgi:serine/threonine protein kinase
MSSSNPGPTRLVSTPPDSPSKKRKALNIHYAEGAVKGKENIKFLHSAPTITPPATPTQSKFDWNTQPQAMGPISTPTNETLQSSNTNLAELEDMQIVAENGNAHQEADKAEVVATANEPPNTEVKTFPYWITDYTIGEPKSNRTVLGTGLWSDVYLGTPTPPKASSTTALPSAPHASSPTFTASAEDSLKQIPEPPPTPSHSRQSSRELQIQKLAVAIPTAYAIKSPASRSAKQVLATEASILSYLSRFPDSSAHIVPFYGQDPRTEALVLAKMDMTLEHWVKSHLNKLPEEQRAGKLAADFPRIAKRLLASLHWLGEKGVVHGDIKPGNILLGVDSTTGAIGKIVYSDFSSATITNTSDSAKQTSTSTSLGGGSWDFLDPTILTSHSSSSNSPTFSSDLWSLAVTLLYVVIGASPFDGVGTNMFRRRECVKQGDPLLFAAYGDDGPQNLARVKEPAQILGGWDVKAWFGKVLIKDSLKRVELEEWVDEILTSTLF